MSETQRHPGYPPSRKTVRLRFRYTDGELTLVSKQHLPMITPPAIGPPPEAGRHEGFWIELKDDSDQALFHRFLSDPFRTSVEIHSPDGQIRREFGPAQDSEFEVLVPDVDAKAVVLMGKPVEGIGPKKPRAQDRVSTELKRFDLSHSGESDDRGSAK